MDYDPHRIDALLNWNAESPHDRYTRVSSEIDRLSRLPGAQDDPTLAALVAEARRLRGKLWILFADDLLTREVAPVVEAIRALANEFEEWRDTQGEEALRARLQEPARLRALARRGGLKKRGKVATRNQKVIEVAEELRQKGNKIPTAAQVVARLDIHLVDDEKRQEISRVRAILARHYKADHKK